MLTGIIAYVVSSCLCSAVIISFVHGAKNRPAFIRINRK
jgi:hypothetical protein